MIRISLSWSTLVADLSALGFGGITRLAYTLRGGNVKDVWMVSSSGLATVFRINDDVSQAAFQSQLTTWGATGSVSVVDDIEI